ncbi:hypothetical protein KSD_72880 [Ktedonobacter sp. SOSP1-85]|nr:hypothetical protein KSD_72880 [Ktedonobacter sp. SOSP1-85]
MKSTGFYHGISNAEVEVIEWDLERVDGTKNGVIGNHIRLSLFLNNFPFSIHHRELAVFVLNHQFQSFLHWIIAQNRHKLLTAINQLLNRR